MPSFWCGATENRSFSTLSRLKIAHLDTPIAGPIYSVYPQDATYCGMPAAYETPELREQIARALLSTLHGQRCNSTTTEQQSRSRSRSTGAPPTKIIRKDPLKSEAILPLARSLAAGCECGCVKSSGHQVWQSAGLLEPATLRALPRWSLAVCFNLVGSDPRTVALLVIST